MKIGKLIHLPFSICVYVVHGTFYDSISSDFQTVQIFTFQENAKRKEIVEIV
jgi:hypothetical protein